MKIFITGIAGFLGSHLADHFINQGHEVSGNDNLIGGYKENINPKAKFYNQDCCDFEAMKAATVNCDIVIHTAATAHEGLSVFSPSFITKNIFEASVSIISASIQNKVKRFIFCSSMARYGNQATPFKETMEPKPVDPYGIAKVAAEKVLETLSSVHGMEYNIVVPHNIIGPRQRYDDPFRNVVSIMINRNLQNLPAIIYGDGNQVRCFSYVDDCISCIDRVVTDEKIKYQTINIGPDENPITINELANIVKNYTGYNGDPIYFKDRPQEVKFATCSSDKARQLLGYSTKTKLDTAVEKTVNYIKDKGTKPFDYSYPIEIINDITPRTWKDKII